MAPTSACTDPIPSDTISRNPNPNPKPERENPMKTYKAMKLGELIAALEELGETPIEQLHSPDSYRGYYNELGFELSTSMVAASINAGTARLCVGQTFQGYKGGDYTMTEHTPVWIHQYGTTAGSGRIVGIRVRGGRGEFVIAGDVW